ncbi:MAG TPA: SulP family inorganic anion transporter [Halothiobacillus sp.]|nr:SulP family inorganic anion transporter [Halothiobacillus sp.]
MGIKLFSGLRPLTRKSVRRDTAAGLSLAAMDIPKVLGYTHIAAMPIVTGLYTIFLPLIAFAIFGSSRQLVVAADSATAAILASGISPLATPESAKYVALVGMVALLAAGLLLLARLFKLGFLADFLSRTVLIGFLAGVGIQVAIAMLGDLLGVKVTAQDSIQQIVQVLQQIGHISLPTVLVSLVVLVAIGWGRASRPTLPIPLVVVLGSIGASYFGHFTQYGIATIGPIPGGLPTLSLPSSITIHELMEVLPIALSCVVIIIAQSAASARGFALKHQERVDENANILGLSVANAAAALSGTFVVNGSPTQTALADSLGSRSQWTQVVFAGIVALVLLFLTAPIAFLPNAVLGAIVLLVAVNMIDLASLRAMRKESTGEFILALVTAVTVVVAGVMEGILLAAVLSLLRHVHHSYRPHTAILQPDAAGHWLPKPAKPGTDTQPGLLVYRFSADLFYANDYRFTDEVRTLVEKAPHPVHWLIFDASAITDIDYSAARSVLELFAELQRQGVHMLFARITPGLKEDMDRHGITAVIGDNNLYLSMHDALRHAEASLSVRSAEQ